MPEAPTGRGWDPGPRPGPPGNRGGPPRGVDVKPLAGPGPGPGSGTLRGPGTGFRALLGPLGHPRGTPGGLSGSPRPPKTPNPGFSRSQPSREGGFTSTPRAGAPRYFSRDLPKMGKNGQKWAKMPFFAVFPGIPHFRPFLAKNGHFSPFWGNPGKSTAGPRREGLM